MSGKDVKPELAKGFVATNTLTKYNRRDLIMYALGIGATDLRYSYELNPQFAMFPTFPVVLTFKGDSFDVVEFGSPHPTSARMPPKAGSIPGIPPYNPSMALHGEQYLEVLRPLPTEADLMMTTKVLGVYDKGSGLLIDTETSLADPKTGDLLCRMVSGGFIRGMGGFGGEKKAPEPSYAAPKREPDAVHSQKTSEIQALMYRLSGDYNPLHADPEIAKMVKFPKPILHGLCTFGHGASAVLKTFANNDASRFRAIKVRFASPVFPGETLETRMWRDDTNKNRVLFEVWVKERNVKVISNAYVDLVGNAAL
eukprot:Clim_evm72s215 gene=Clim_evmTU72s215